MVDPGFNRKKLWIEPGIGNFGGKYKTTFLQKTLKKITDIKTCLLFIIVDRYFGTEEDED